MDISKITLQILKYAFIAFLALIIWVYASIYYENTRKRQGYCTWKKDQENVLLTREQRLDLAINAYLQNQTSIDYREIELAEEHGQRKPDYWKYFESHFTLMRYNSKEDLLKENSQCCALVGVEVPAPSGDFWDWESNPGTNVFEIKHKIRYADQSGYAKEIISTHTYFAIDNCGGIEPIFPL